MQPFLEQVPMKRYNIYPIIRTIPLMKDPPNEIYFPNNVPFPNMKIYEDCSACMLYIKSMQLNNNCLPCIKEVKPLNNFLTTYQQTLHNDSFLQEESSNSIGIYGKDGCFYPVYKSPQSAFYYIQMFNKHCTSFTKTKIDQDLDIDCSATSIQKTLEPSKSQLVTSALKSSVEKLYKPLNAPRFPSSRPLLMGLKPSRIAP